MEIRKSELIRFGIVYMLYQTGDLISESVSLLGYETTYTFFNTHQEYFYCNNKMVRSEDVPPFIYNELVRGLQ